MKQLRHRAIRDLVSTPPHPDPAGAGRRLSASAASGRPRRRCRATWPSSGSFKAARDGTQAYALPKRLIEAESSGEDRLRALLRDLPIELREAGLLLVIRTLPGSAHAIAAALDRARWPEVAGSIAGDDTVFVACPDRTALRRVTTRIPGLRRLSPGSREPSRRRSGSVTPSADISPSVGTGVGAGRGGPNGRRARASPCTRAARSGARSAAWVWPEAVPSPPWITPADIDRRTSPTGGRARAGVFDREHPPRYPFGRSNFRRDGVVRSLEFFPLSDARGRGRPAPSTQDLGAPDPMNTKPTYLSKDGLDKLRTGARRDDLRQAARGRPADPRRQGARRPQRERRVRGRQERAGVRRGPDPDAPGADQERHDHRREPLDRPRPDRLDRQGRQRRRRGVVHDRRLDRGQARPRAGSATRARSGAPCSARRRARRSS